jgi:acyl-CoA thioesterase YciA
MNENPTRVHVTSRLCMTRDVGLRRTLFGGNMMAWMDEACSIFAHQYTGELTLVTLKFGEIHFVNPVFEGHIVNFFVENPKVGRSSIRFDLEGVTDQNVLVVKTNAVFVAIGPDGKPKPIEKFLDSAGK